MHFILLKSLRGAWDHNVQEHTVLGFVIGVVHGKVKFCAATVAKQATVLGSIRNCIGTLVTRTIALKYQVHQMLLFCQSQRKYFLATHGLNMWWIMNLSLHVRLVLSRIIQN